MAYFDRRDKGGDRDYKRGSYSTGPKRPAEMHAAICAKCGNECQVPFRPTAGKPVYCSKCFDRNTTPRREDSYGNSRDSRDSRSQSYDSRTSGRFERPSFRSESPRESFSAVCANCGKDCTLPFEPKTDKPVYCSNCFEKQGGNNRERPMQTPPQYHKQFESINVKLDKILKLLGAEPEVTTESLDSDSEESEAEAESEEIIIEDQPEAEEAAVEVKEKAAKKKSSKKA